VFKSDSAYGPFKPGPNVAGHFQAGTDVNYIALSTEVNGTQDPFNVIFHEYTHLLVNNTFESAPLWFNEGLAEYYSTFKITDDQKVALGTAIGHHVFLLRGSKMLPLKTLFQVDHKSPHYNEREKQGIFYAQSWAFLHYMLIGKAGKVEQLSKFLDLITANVPLDEAFQQAFEMPFEAMEKELKNYVKQDRYNVLNGHFSQKLELDTSAAATPLTEAEAQAYLGDLLLHSHRADSVKYIEKALKLDPNLAMAHASMGMAYFYQGKVAEAQASLERAVAANSQNYLAHYYYAFTLSRPPVEGQPVTGYSAEVAKKIREHLQKAIALRPDYPESYNLLGFVSLVTGENVDEAIASLKQALSDSPGRDDFASTLGQLYMRKNDYKAARQMFEQVSKSETDEQMRQYSQTMLEQLRKIEENRELYESAKKRANDAQREPDISYAPAATRTTDSTGTRSSEPAPSTVPQPASDPSSYLREVLRPPGEGETQLQATLLRLECDGKGVTFVLQTANGLLRLRTASLEDIEITTYDPKVKGELTCGERKPENPVIVCFTPNSDKKIKADGILKSIEFVPVDFKLKAQ
jgi:tetratricopeptide (TPR) repeat protein